MHSHKNLNLKQHKRDNDELDDTINLRIRIEILLVPLSFALATE